MSITPNISPSQLKGLNATVKSAKLKSKADTASAIIDIVGSVGTAIITLSYQKKNSKLQAQIEEELSKLSDSQREEIKSNLLKINDENERLANLVNYLADNLGTQSANDLRNSINTNVLGAVNKQTKQIYWFFGISLAVLIAIVVVKKIRK